MIKKPLLLSLMTLLFTFEAYSQEKPISPENNPINTLLIKNEKFEMTYYMLKDSLKMEIGKLTTEVQKKNGKLVIIKSLDLKGLPGQWVDSTVAKANSLKPIYHSSYNMQRDMVLNFGESVTGYYMDKRSNKKTVISGNPSQAYFDSNIYPFLIRFLPLKEGYKTSIRICNYSPRGKQGFMKAYVKAVEEGYLDGRTVWVVKTTDDSSNTSVVTYYIDQETREILKRKIEADGRKMVMKLTK